MMVTPYQIARPSAVMIATHTALAAVNNAVARRLIWVFLL